MRFIAPDLRGCGRSDKPKGEYTAELQGTDMDEFWRYAKMQMAQDCETHSQLTAMATVPIWVGYSMGGRVALQVATTKAEYVKGLVLVSSGIGQTNPSPEAQKRRDEMIALAQKGDIKKLAEMMTENAFTPGFKAKNGKAYDQYLKVKMAQKAETVLAQLTGMAKSGAPDLSKLKCPVLFIVGQNDQNWTPDMAKAASGKIPNSKVVVLPTGHASPIEAPDQFNAAVKEWVATLK
jgi:pimeloyl-ACP methyl ester carboxylesterase